MRVIETLQMVKLMTRILHIDSSARLQGSVTRELSGNIVKALNADGTAEITVRDLATPLPLITEAWVGANFTPSGERTEPQRAELSLSDTLVEELKQADTIVIGVPIYNFSVPAALKAWIDLVARAGVTFRYTENGVEGLLKGKKAVIALASGGVREGSDVDYAGRYMRHVLGFIGISDVEFISADQMSVDGGDSLSRARASVEKLAA